MAKCVKCGKSGLFLKVNSDRLCKDCEALNTPVAPLKFERQNNTEIAPVSKELDNPLAKFNIHEDIKGLLWFGDSPLQNFSEKDLKTDDNTWNVGNFSIKIGFDINEPSLIYTSLPIEKPKDESLVPRPPYFPQYENLSPEQKWVYLKLLSNPYNTDIDIGYVFILYYGLERHLLNGKFDDAFMVILKLRDVHKNKSFQHYSGNALVLSSMLKNKGEYALTFIKSLDNEYEYNFSENLFLICYYSFNIPLLPKDIMRMAKVFEFTNNNYIKKYPAIFEECLKNVIIEKTGYDKIDIKKYITDSELKKLKSEKVMIFANSSIKNNSMPVPQMADNFKLKKEINILLESAHESAKKKITSMRKEGDLTEPVKEEKPKLPPIDLNSLKEPSTKKDIMSQFYEYGSMIYDLWQHRNESGVLAKIVDVCEKQLELTPRVIEHFAKIKEQVKRELIALGFSGDLTANEEISRIMPSQDDFIQGILHPETPTGSASQTAMEKVKLLGELSHGLELEADTISRTTHEGYYRLCMIAEKEKNWKTALQIAELAKSEGWYIKDGWDKRIEKYREKLG
jgi:hypothetical protein